MIRILTLSLNVSLSQASRKDHLPAWVGETCLFIPLRFPDWPQGFRRNGRRIIANLPLFNEAVHNLNFFFNYLTFLPVPHSL